MLSYADLVPSVILPSPTEVLQAFPVLHFEEALVRSAVRSLYRVTMGFLLAAAVAIPLGHRSWAPSPPVKHFFAPLLDPLRFLPISALVPLFIVWFGIDEMQKIVFLFVGIVVYLLPLVVEAVENVDEVYLQTATTLGATQRPARPPRADPGQPARHRRGAAGDERDRLDLRDPGRGDQRPLRPGLPHHRGRQALARRPDLRPACSSSCSSAW